MTQNALRKQVIHKIERLSLEKLKAINTLLPTEEETIHPAFTPELTKELDERLESGLAGKSKSYTKRGFVTKLNMRYGTKIRVKD